jgi:hypothetical protein
VNVSDARRWHGRVGVLVHWLRRAPPACARVAFRVVGWHWGRGVSDAGRWRGWVFACAATATCSARLCARVSLCVGLDGLSMCRMRGNCAAAWVCLCTGRDMPGRPMLASSRTVPRWCGGPEATCPRGRVSGCACGCGCKQHHLPVRARRDRFTACGLRGVGTPCCHRVRLCVGAHCVAAVLAAHPVRHGPPACVLAPAASLGVAWSPAWMGERRGHKHRLSVPVPACATSVNARERSAT